MHQTRTHGSILRRAGIAGAAAVVLAGTALPATAADAAADAAPAPPTVASTQDLGAITQNANILYNGPFASGRDNGQSTSYQGHSVWIFNDTALTSGQLVSNTGAMTDDLDASDGITLTSGSPFTSNDSGAPGAVVDETAAESAFQTAHNGDCTYPADEYCGSQYAFWPGAIVADPARHRLLTFYGKLCRGQSDADAPCYNGFAGQLIGNGVAELDMDTGTVTRLTAQNMPAPVQSIEGADPTLLFGPDDGYGNNSAVVSGDTLYAYGHCTNYRCRLARVPLASVQDRAQWTFYTGDVDGVPQWSSDETDAVQIMDSGAAGGTVEWVPALQEWLDVYLAPLSNTAYYEVASNPWGPWSSAQAMFTADPPASSVDYALYGHAEYAQNDGLTQYLSYFQPGTGYQMLERVDFQPAG
jgi:uncharacterized protein DUF4185